MVYQHPNERSTITDKILIFITILVVSFNTMAQSIFFTSEQIEIAVFPEFCEVRGDYHFQNKENRSPQIIYPFVINDNLNFPDSIAIFQKNLTPINYRQGKNAITFTLKGQYFGSYYHQQTPGHYFEYILTSTAAWDKPLAQATYIIKLHHSLELTDLSIPYNDVEKGKNFTIYKTLRKNFMPKKNIIIQWSEK